jgi:ABC-type cobalt transport system substrate-binding protein
VGHTPATLYHRRMPRAATTLFEDAIDIPLWLEADRLTPHAERSRRDRAIGLTLSGSDRVQRVRGWWRAVAPEEDGAGARLQRIRVAITAVMVLLGAMLGVGVALAAFQYDGSQPVNVVRLIALLVVVPALFLVASLLFLPGRIFLLRGLQDLLAPLNPGAVALAVFRRIARASPELARSFDWRAGRSSTARFAKWQLMCWSQVAAVAFNVAALVTALLLVTFTDLAFRWSTTLEVEPQAVTRVVHAIAWPWHALIPSAVPSAALVEESQFFRLDDALVSGRALAAWWPFTVLTLLTYGLLPRLVLLAVSVVRLRAAERAVLLDDRGVTALVDRMASAAVETAAAEHAESLAAPSADAADYPQATGRARAVIWEGCVSAERAREHARKRLGLDLVAVVEAGGSRTLGADRQALDALTATDPGTVVVLTPAWEPPLLELLDFLGALRKRVGTEHSIVVAPVADTASTVTAVEHETWARAIGKLRDPRLYVEASA